MKTSTKFITYLSILGLGWSAALYTARHNRSTDTTAHSYASFRQKIQPCEQAGRTQSEYDLAFDDLHKEIMQVLYFKNDPQLKEAHLQNARALAKTMDEMHEQTRKNLEQCIASTLK